MFLFQHIDFCFGVQISLTDYDSGTFTSCEILKECGNTPDRSVDSANVLFSKYFFFYIRLHFFVKNVKNIRPAKPIFVVLTKKGSVNEMHLTYLQCEDKLTNQTDKYGLTYGMKKFLYV